MQSPTSILLYAHTDLLVQNIGIAQLYYYITIKIWRWEPFKNLQAIKKYYEIESIPEPGFRIACGAITAI